MCFVSRGKVEHRQRRMCISRELREGVSKGEKVCIVHRAAKALIYAMNMSKVFENGTLGCDAYLIPVKPSKEAFHRCCDGA